jgi:hypothetical protein
MARTRQVKPSFFTNEILSELPPMCRLIFIGLWVIADREGRLEYRLKRIRAEIAPYENLTSTVLERYLHQLADNGFLELYGFNGQIMYIQVVNFLKHQHPHIAEKQSQIPDWHKVNACTEQAPYKYSASTVQEPVKNALIPYTLLPNTELTQSEEKPDCKKKFLNCILLTDDQYEKLIEKFGKQGADDRIEDLNLGILSHGYKYKSHYAAILAWDKRDQKETKKEVSVGYSIPSSSR